MSIEGVTNQVLFSDSSKPNHGTATKDNIPGIKPVSYDKYGSGKLHCAVGKDIYDVNCQSVAKIIEGVKPSQLTGGCGGG